MTRQDTNLSHSIARLSAHWAAEETLPVTANLEQSRTRLSAVYNYPAANKPSQ